MSRILKKMALLAIAVSCSFGMENDVELLRRNIKFSLINACEKPPTEEDIETALKKIVPYVSQLKSEEKINLMEYYDGQFCDTLCHLRALKWYFLTLKNHEFFNKFIPAFDLATRKKYYDLNIVRYPLQDLDYLKESIKNLKAGKDISGEQNFATALRSAYLQEMYRFFGYSLNDPKIRFVKGLTPQFSYPALEFFESYYFMINQIEKFKIPVTVLYMDFVNNGSDISLCETSIFTPYKRNQENLSIVFEMYSNRDITDKPFELPLNDSKFFREAVLEIAAVHSQYPDSNSLKPDILLEEAKPYYELAITNNFGISPLFELNKKTKTVSPTKKRIDLNTFHVYLSDESLRLKRVAELNAKKGEKLQYMGDK